ncbi:MAG TPA: hypothetical protein VMK42_18315 [Anaeromyxobacteraceae bacterium]|nr:hypothetical protein [Anaeromyxobacteraceae bacterium]
MRHSGRVLRPPGPDFPEGLFPDLWGFGASSELPPVTLPSHRVRPRPGGATGIARRDPIAVFLERIGRLFS